MRFFCGTLKTNAVAAHEERFTMVFFWHFLEGIVRIFYRRVRSAVSVTVRFYLVLHNILCSVRAFLFTYCTRTQRRWWVYFVLKSRNQNNDHLSMQEILD